jgi:hypothetical protein
VESSSECGNELSGSMKNWEISTGYTIGGISSSVHHHRGSLLGNVP